MHLIYKKTLFMQKIIDKLDLLNKTVTIQSNVKTKKKILSFATKLIKIYQILVILKNTINLIWTEKTQKVLKRSKTITQPPKTLEIPNFVDIKSVLIEHSKTGNVENVPLESATDKNSDSPLYSETKKVKII